ncbi:MAG TPA: glycine cleavage T C-terminal barrel domain-containing protein, partial [Roseimicrobium sp.]|nr:glycine cleavage T C-terminal barrel domain-containing protein [Roseimicrobium sp.]
TYLLIINASRIDADVPWLEKSLTEFPDKAGVQLQNVSDSTSAVAVQGPKVVELINGLVSGKSVGGLPVSTPSELKKNQIASFEFQGKPVWLGRTGYTGEDGFEIVAPNELIEAVWNKLLEIGQPHGLKAAGLGARDTLRTEVCFPLYGHELDEQTTPIEAGLGYFVALDKGEFTGRSVLADQKAKGIGKKLVAFKMTGKSAPPRPHYAVWNHTEANTTHKIGEVVSGTQSPSLGTGIGLAYVPPAYSQVGTPLIIEIRNQRVPAEVVSKPFYRKAN